MIINKYRFGNHVYGTQTAVSDEGFICVSGEKTVTADINTQYYTVDEFQRLLNNHEIQMLECYFLPEQHILQENKLPLLTGIQQLYRQEHYKDTLMEQEQTLRQMANQQYDAGTLQNYYIKGCGHVLWQKMLHSNNTKEFRY